MDNNSNSLAGPIISGASSVVGSLLTGGFNLALNKRAFNQQMKLQHDAQAFSREMWNASNEYNTPAAQMSRLRQAGINPNSAFGGVEGTAQGAAPPTGSAGSAPAPPYFDGSMFNMSPDTFAAIDKMKADAKLADTQAEGQSITNKNLDEQYRWEFKKAEQWIKTNEAQVKAFAAAAGLDEAQTEQVKKLTPILAAKGEAERDNIKAATEKYEMECKQADAEIKLLKEKLNTEKSAQAANYASVEASQASASLMREQENTQRQQTTKESVEAQIRSYEKKKEFARIEYEHTLYSNSIDPKLLGTSNPFQQVYTAISISNAMPAPKHKGNVNTGSMPKLR